MYTFLLKLELKRSNTLALPGRAFILAEHGSVNNRNLDGLTARKAQDFKKKTFPCGLTDPGLEKAPVASLGHACGWGPQLTFLHGQHQLPENP